MSFGLAKARQRLAKARQGSPRLAGEPRPVSLRLAGEGLVRAEARELRRAGFERSAWGREGWYGAHARTDARTVLLI